MQHHESTQMVFFLLFSLQLSHHFNHSLFNCLNYLFTLELDQQIYFQYIFCEVHTIYFLILSLMLYDQFRYMHVYFLVFLFQIYQHHLLETLHHLLVFLSNLAIHSYFPKAQLFQSFPFLFYSFIHSILKELFFVFLILNPLF